MTIKVINGINVHFASGDGPSLSSEQDALDLIGETYGTEAEMIAVPSERFARGFFDLSTRQLGHFFQKLQNYRMRLAICGDISDQLAASQALRDFVRETNQTGHHLFVDDPSALGAFLRGGS